jgi:hypothetical protein
MQHTLICLVGLRLSGGAIQRRNNYNDHRLRVEGSIHMLARRDPHHNQAEGQGRVTKGNSVSGPRSRAHPRWNERLVAAAGDAVGKRPNPQLGEGGGETRAEDECVGDRRDIYQKCGSVDEIGGCATKRALLGEGGRELARTRSLGTRGALQGGSYRKNR